MNRCEAKHRIEVCPFSGTTCQTSSSRSKFSVMVSVGSLAHAYFRSTWADHSGRREDARSSTAYEVPTCSLDTRTAQTLCSIGVVGVVFDREMVNCFLCRPTIALICCVCTLYSYFQRPSSASIPCLRVLLSLGNVSVPSRPAPPSGK